MILQCHKSAHNEEFLLSCAVEPPLANYTSTYISSFTIYFFWLVQAKKSEKKRQSQKLKDPRPFSKKATLSDNCFISNLYVISRKLHRFVPS